MKRWAGEEEEIWEEVEQEASAGRRMTLKGSRYCRQVGSGASASSTIGLDLHFISNHFIKSDAVFGELIPLWKQVAFCCFPPTKPFSNQRRNCGSSGKELLT